ncbi:TetR/AcrR family transcriptional regulator [Actinoplanes sp. NEAU-A12]|uniref:TetR/AcrR family transcriptional regulator n=1 Tax=Actinoplanes sandaracinus TaxID=3045177 RepID=A0ABT6WK60_9ACTN|nr:TetR/AcrR family transcriptional regulator [Actinoplanes sandaracinus]MDI6100108.1 TetR/AcrR family transcriptional regulator [Actinoplanes sandaracinus]
MRTQIASGVVFTTPPSLPRGRHELAREQVLAAQRERMLIAATELLAGSGYRGFGVREICSRAAVSRAAFYECFADKDACVYAAYDRFIAVLVERLAADDARFAAGDGPDWAGCVRGFVATYLAILESDPVAARAFGVEMEALGRTARERRRTALTRLAGFIRELREKRFPGTATAVPLSAYLGAIHALRQIASDALDAEPEPDLTALVPELSAWLCRMVDEPAQEETR